MVSLCFSSFLFATTVIHAFHSNDMVYHHLMLCVMALSIGVHTFYYISYYNDGNVMVSTYLRYLCLVDKIMAHAGFCIVFSDILMMIYKNPPFFGGLLVFPCAISLLWYLEHQPKWKHAERSVHTVLHLTSICAVHCVLWIKTSLKHDNY